MKLFTGKLKDLTPEALELLTHAYMDFPKLPELESLMQRVVETSAFNDRDKGVLHRLASLATLTARHLDMRDLRRQAEKS